MIFLGGVTFGNAIVLAQLIAFVKVYSFCLSEIWEY